MTLFRATLDTRNFHFEAFGPTMLDAVNALDRGLVAHGEQYKLPRDWHIPFMEDAAVSEAEIGACYRDGEKLP